MTHLRDTTPRAAGVFANEAFITHHREVRLLSGPRHPSVSDTERKVGGRCGPAKDDLLTHATIYWVNNSIATSMRYYANANRYP